MKTVKLFAALGLLGTLGASMPADAATTVVPGIACKSQDPDEEHQLHYWYFGSVENTLTGGSDVATICPLPRNNGAVHLTGTAYVRVWNQSASTLNCSFSIVPQNATSGDIEILAATAVGYNSLPVDTSLLSSFPYGRIFANCFLFPGDEIDSIRFTEP